MSHTFTETAQAAAAKAASRFGMCPTSISLLSDSNNTVMLLHPYRVVAKVATGHHRRLGLELDVARTTRGLAANGVTPCRK